MRRWRWWRRRSRSTRSSKSPFSINLYADDDKTFGNEVWNVLPITVEIRNTEETMMRSEKEPGER